MVWVSAGYFWRIMQERDTFWGNWGPQKWRGLASQKYYISLTYVKAVSPEQPMSYNAALYDRWLAFQEGRTDKLRDMSDRSGSEYLDELS